MHAAPLGLLTTIALFAAAFCLWLAIFRPQRRYSLADLLALLTFAAFAAALSRVAL